MPVTFLNKIFYFQLILDKFGAYLPKRTTYLRDIVTEKIFGHHINLSGTMNN